MALLGRKSLQGAKVPDYAAAILGDINAMAIDRHVAGILFDTHAPTAPQIRAAKERITQIAERLGWTPREAQTALWAANIMLEGNKVYGYEAYLPNTGSKSTPYSPKTGPEKAEAFRLLGQSREN